MNYLGIPELKTRLQTMAMSFSSANNKSKPLLPRMVPQSYLRVDEEIAKCLARKLANGELPYLEENDFRELIVSVPENDIDDEELEKGVCVI